MTVLLWASTQSAAQERADNIRAIQQFLEVKGCDPNGVDGQWGGGSTSAAQRYHETSGVMLEPESNLDSWPARFLVPTCEDDISLADPGQILPYETPIDTVELPGGFSQYNWIPMDLREFEWPEGGALVTFGDRAGHFTQESLSALGCLPGADNVAHLQREYLSHDISYEGLLVGDFPLITMASDFLAPSICAQTNRPLAIAAQVFIEWAQRGAFENYGLKQAVAEHRDNIYVTESGSQLVSFTLVTREQIAQYLVLWMIIKSELTDLEVDDIQSVEAWFERLVEEQAFPYAGTPLDCPSFDAMPRGIRIPGYMRGDEFEECINTGTSRAGVSALWALLSGDRTYAVDALNSFFMTLHQLRTDGSHLLESARGPIAHYKAAYNLAWMQVVAETFLAAGIDIYASDVDGRSIHTMAEFLAKAAIDQELNQLYSGASSQEHREFKDAAQWIILSRFPDSNAARLILRQLAAMEDREQIEEKFFRLRPPGDRQDGTSYLQPLLPFTALFAPSDVLEFAPPDIASNLLNEEGYCPPMNWAEADEEYAGLWQFAWAIKNINDDNLHHGGVDRVELSGGRGRFVELGASDPRREYRRELEIRYGDGRLCVAGPLNLFDPTPVHIVVLEGAFAEGTLTGRWPDGDEFQVELRR